MVRRKRQDNVIRLIRARITEAGEWGVLNFKDTPYLDPQNGQAYPMFTMTMDGDQFLLSPVAGCATTLLGDGSR